MQGALLSLAVRVAIALLHRARVALGGYSTFTSGQVAGRLNGFNEIVAEKYGFY